MLVGCLADGVAHDLNNVLAAIFLELDRIRQTPRWPAELTKSIEDLQGEAERASGLVRQLLSFGRRTETKMELVDLNGVVEEFLDSLRSLLGKNLRVDFQASPGLPRIRGTAGLVRQVLASLCLQARDAMPKGGGCLEIATSSAFGDLGSRPTAPPSPPGKFVRLSVRGSNLPAERGILGSDLSDGGNGLFLAVANEALRQNNGWVEAENEEGDNNLVRAYFPVGEESREPKAPEDRGKRTEGGRETILLVEDTVSLRRSIALYLRKLGYAVLEADCGDQAIQLWERRDGKADLLLTDLVTPGKVNGIELARRLHRESPALKVILSSGCSAALPEMGPPSLTGLSFLAKPYTASVLADAVRRCLVGK